MAASVASVLVALLAFLLVRRRRRRRQAQLDMEAGAPAPVPHASLAVLGKRELQLAKTGGGPAPAAPGAASHLPPGEDPGLPSPGQLSPLSSLTIDPRSPPLPAPPGVPDTHAAHNLGGDSPIPPSPSIMSTSLSHSRRASQGVAADSSSPGCWEGNPAGEDEAGGGVNPLFRGGLSLPWTEGVLRRDQIEILRRRDGTPWTLGRGACGTVRGDRCSTGLHAWGVPHAMPPQPCCMLRLTFPHLLFAAAAWLLPSNARVAVQGCQQCYVLR
jgi:hypothetical protein